MPRYIDADALFKTVNRRFYNALEVGSKESQSGRFRRGYNIAITDACNDIISAPTLSPDDVRGVGEWEDAKQYGLCRCSVCKDCFIEKEWVVYEKWKYCPSCGARMKGAERKL